ncbi:hypothetical protein Aasi_1604 [Candidatus Amoebophilus asiaticus 5a2]|uniref:Uncharacterized protein n=1 Tax=Amoebophilus asiaticus (strain 5a2) TaxID=452471 RepID=C3L4K5_AMOA5|nr:hypothetical protein Aasi_1604 [Candidatus Amoebophilus asiaticus 5a2]
MQIGNNASLLREKSIILEFKGLINYAYSYLQQSPKKYKYKHTWLPVCKILKG